MIRSANYELRPPHFHLRVVPQTDLLQDRLRNAHATGIADLDHANLHNYIVITERPDVNLLGTALKSP